MRLPRVRFTVRAIMVAVAVLAVYAAVFIRSQQAGVFMAVVTAPPLIWASRLAAGRSEKGDPMSAVEWAAHVLIGSMIACFLSIPLSWLVEALFPMYST